MIIQCFRKLVILIDPGANDTTGLVLGVAVVFHPCPDLMERDSSPFSRVTTGKLREEK